MNIGLKRLEKLAKHLESGKLGHEKFDFTLFNYGHKEGQKPNTCGTMGCALGECPILFPKQWKFTNHGSVTLIKTDRMDFNAATEFFQINLQEAPVLFSCNCQKLIRILKLKKLFCNATPKQVAANIRKFIIYKKKIFAKAKK